MKNSDSIKNDEDNKISSRLSHAEKVRQHADKAKAHAKKTYNCVGEILKRRRDHAQQLALEQAAAAKKLVSETLIMRPGESLKDSDAIKIAKRITKEDTLLFVDIHGNKKITDKGLKAIAEGLKINSTLKELIYWNNVVSLEGALIICICRSS